MTIFPVKNFLSTDTGAPPLNGTAGSRISLLDAILVTGFNLKSAVSLTQAAGMAIATFATAHGYRPYQIIEVAGCTGGSVGYNGQYMVTSTTTNTITFPVDSALPGSAAGTITVKVAPLGWQKTYSGTNKAAYKSIAVGATGCYLRVDDSNSQYALIRGYEAMTDVDTGTGPFPTSAQQANYNWKGSSTTDATARKYSILGTDKTVMLALAWQTASGNNYSSSQWPAVFGFGDFLSFKAGDAFNCFISGHTTTNTSVPAADSSLNKTGQLSPYCPRSYTQTGSSLQLYKPPIAQNATSGINDSTTSNYPNESDNALIIMGRHFLQESAGSNYRGVQPGLYHLPQKAPLADGDIITGVTGFPEKIFFMLGCSSISSFDGRAAIDITGPWDGI